MEGLLRGAEAGEEVGGGVVGLGPPPDETEVDGGVLRAAVVAFMMGVFETAEVLPEGLFCEVGTEGVLGRFCEIGWQRW